MQENCKKKCFSVEHVFSSEKNELPLQVFKSSLQTKHYIVFLFSGATSLYLRLIHENQEESHCMWPHLQPNFERVTSSIGKLLKVHKRQLFLLKPQSIETFFSGKCNTTKAIENHSPTPSILLSKIT